MKETEYPMKETEHSMKKTQQAIINEQPPGPPPPAPHNQYHRYEEPKQEEEEEKNEETHTISLPPLPPKTTTTTMNNHNNNNYLSSPPPQKNIEEDSPSHDISLSSPSPQHLHLHHLQQINQSHYSVSPSEPALTKNVGPPPPPHTVHVQDGDAKEEEGSGGGGRRLRQNMTMLRRAKRENMKRTGVLVLRCLGCLLCLVSFSVLAADQYKGWALDSFFHYIEFSYLVGVNVMGFVYSGLQASELLFSLSTGKNQVTTQLRNYFDFALDQILTYLLLSASSSASFRVEDWESNWGKDKFPSMARTSVAFSFLGFLAFALSSLFSGYTLFSPKYL